MYDQSPLIQALPGLKGIGSIYHLLPLHMDGSDVTATCFQKILGLGEPQG